MSTHVQSLVSKWKYKFKRKFKRKFKFKQIIHFQ